MTHGIDAIDRALSVFAAANERPHGLAIRSERVDYTWAEAASRVAACLETIERPATGRPMPFVAEADVECLITLLAAFEAKIPLLLISPKLTTPEREAVIRMADAIEAPLPSDAAVVIFTSGTTGSPKPVVLTRTGLVESARRVAEALYMTHDDVFQLSLSPARVGGLGIVMRSLVMRSAMSLAGRFKAETFMANLARDGVTLASVVPAMLSEILDKTPSMLVPTHLRTLMVGGAAASMALRQRAAAAGIPIVTTYGMTEAGSTVAVTPYEERFEPQIYAGRILDGLEAKLTNDIITLRGPMLSTDYWGRGSTMQEGWYLTGDIGSLTADHRVRVSARHAELIITGGENVAPREVEEVLESIPGVKAALVLGQPDEKWGALVTALLVPDADKTPPSDNEIVGFLRPRLARWKSPRRFAWVKTLPLTAGGKPCRAPNVLEGMTLQTLHYATR